MNERHKGLSEKVDNQSEGGRNPEGKPFYTALLFPNEADWFKVHKLLEELDNYRPGSASPVRGGGMSGFIFTQRLFERIEGQLAGIEFETREVVPFSQLSAKDKARFRGLPNTPNGKNE